MRTKYYLVRGHSFARLYRTPGVLAEIEYLSPTSKDWEESNQQIRLPDGARRTKRGEVAAEKTEGTGMTPFDILLATERRHDELVNRLADAIAARPDKTPTDNEAHIIEQSARSVAAAAEAYRAELRYQQDDMRRKA